MGENHAFRYLGNPGIKIVLADLLRGVCIEDFEYYKRWLEEKFTHLIQISLTPAAESQLVFTFLQPVRVQGGSGGYTRFQTGERWQLVLHENNQLLRLCQLEPAATGSS